MRRGISALLLGLILFTASAPAAELLELASENWDAVAPQGKEVDAIYGDYVLRNDKIVAVIAKPGPERDANLTVHDVGGAVIDLTSRTESNDQLSAYFPLAERFHFTGRAEWPIASQASTAGDAAIVFQGEPRASQDDSPEPKLTAFVRYNVWDGEDYVTIETAVRNDSSEPIEWSLSDTARVDGGDFASGYDPVLAMWWAHDAFWRQAYGVQSAGSGPSVMRVAGKQPCRIDFGKGEENKHTIKPGEFLTCERRLFVTNDSVALRGSVRTWNKTPQGQVNFTATDPAGPVADAAIELTSTANSSPAGSGVMDAEGEYECQLAPGKYGYTLRAPGSVEAKGEITVAADQTAQTEVKLSEPGYVNVKVTGKAGEPLACKVAFHGRDGTPDPNFGPESAIYGVKNLQYTPTGEFRVPLLPGVYEVVASHGPEFDAVIERITITAGEETKWDAKLIRTVDTTGYLSTEYHSHSTPSGDNTASQRGRVLNLLAEHLEFAPCTEHQRITTYDEHLDFFDARQKLLSCPGMELTGKPLPINHQNAFPLVEHRHQQDGGGPQTDINPIKQIERLAMWDNGSDKVVQTNHPNIAQMIGDKDLNGQPDGGFEKMFAYMDVVEIHPPEMLFDALEVGSGGWDDRGTPIHNWLQLLNLGYRIPGVVNSDAHYNFHGSGWIRNWVKSTTDDPGEASVVELCHETEHGHVICSNGPFMTVSANSGKGESVLPGDDLEAPSKEVRLKVKVQCPNWLEVNRVQLFVNGRPSKEHNYTRRTHADMFGVSPVMFDEELTVKLESDAHLVVAACGEGQKLGIVYGEAAGAAMPTVVANPIFVDVDGDGFEPNGDDLGIALPVKPDHVPSHGHQHPHR